MNQFVKVVLDADPGKLITGFTQADTAAGKLGASFTAVGSLAKSGAQAFQAAADVVEKAGKRIAIVGSAGTAAFGAMGVAAASFQANMLNVRTLMSQDFSDREFQKMGSDVLDLSRKFPQTAGDMSKALYDIASSGFYGADSLVVLKQAALAATAGLSSTANSATAITAVLNAYGLGANKAADVSDVLFQTVNLGVVSFDQLTGVIGESVGTAAAAKVTYAELGSAIATMTLSGISFSEAGVSANRVLQSLIKPSTELRDSLHALGYESGVQAIQVDGLHGVIEKLRIASQGNIATLLQWFPEIRAARGALALMSAEGENYNRVAAGIEDKTKRMGATQRAYNIQSQGAAQGFQLMMNAIHDLGIEIGAKFLPVATILEHAIATVVNFLAGMPGPMKTVIAYGGLLVSAILAIAGAYVAWQAKSFVTQWAIHSLGTAMQYGATQADMQGGAVYRLGGRLKDINGPFATTRAAIAGLTSVGGTSSRVFTRIGTSITGMGERMAFGGGAAIGLGNAFIKVGQSGGVLHSMFQKVAGGVISLVSHLGSLAFAAYAVIATLNASRESAKSWAEEATKAMKPGDPTSTVKALNDIDDKFKQLRKSQEEARTPGGFANLFVKDIADLALSIVGAGDVIKTSAWDQMLKSEELSKSEKKVINSLKNIQTNATQIFTATFPKDQSKLAGPLNTQVEAYEQQVEKIRKINKRMSNVDFFTPIKVPPLDMTKLLPIDSNEIRTISRVAANMGIDLSKAMKVGSPDRQKVIDEYRSIKGLVESTGLSTTKLTEETIAQFQDMAKSIKDSGKAAGTAFSSSFDIFSKIDKEAGNVGGQITDFYKKATVDAKSFYDGIITLQMRGLNPTAVANMIAAGPEKAGPVVEAMVKDVSGKLIDIMNNGEAALDQISQHVVIVAQLTQQAVEDKTGQAAKHLADAIAVTNIMGQIGPLATAEDVAKMLGWDITRVQDAAKIFSLNVASAIKPGDLVKDPFTGAMGPFPATAVQGVKDRQKYSTDLYNTLRTTFGSDVVSSDIENFVKKLDQALYTKSGAATTGETRQKKVEELTNSLQTVFKLPSEKALLLKIVGQEEASTRLEKFRGALFGPKSIPSDQIVNFIISLTGDANALKKIHDVSVQLGLAPTDYAIMLRMLGTDEALIQSSKVMDAITQLQGKDIPVTMNNVDAILKSKDVQTTLEQLYQVALQKGQLTVSATVKGKKDVDDLRETISQTSDKEVHVKTVFEQLFVKGVANGAVFVGSSQHFADGGHNAFITHTQRTFGEPETGGEGYIPLASSKRARSTKILTEIAKMFGYGLTHYAAGGITAMPAMDLTRVPHGGVHLHIKNNYSLSGSGDAAILEMVRTVQDQHDRELTQYIRTHA